MNRSPSIPNSLHSLFGNTYLIEPVIGELSMEQWFHPSISRKGAEQLLQNDGDFLVRKSMANPGQYVLSVQQNNSPKHLLLHDIDGTVCI